MFEGCFCSLTSVCERGRVKVLLHKGSVWDKMQWEQVVWPGDDQHRRSRLAGGMVGFSDLSHKPRAPSGSWDCREAVWDGAASVGPGGGVL